MKVSGEMLAILSSISIGISYPIASVATKEIGALQVASFMPLLSVIFLLSIAFITKQKVQFKTALTKHARDTISVIISRPIIGSVLLLYGFSLTTAIRASFMTRLEPVFVAVMGYIFLKDRLSRKQIYLIAMIVLGAFLLSTGGSLSSLTEANMGDAIIALSMLILAYSYIPARRLGVKITPITTTIVCNLIGGLAIIPIMLVLNISLLTVNASNFWILLADTLSFAVVGLYLYFAALKKAKPWVVGSLLSVSSVVGAVIGFALLGESISVVQAIGASIVLASSYFIARSLK